MRIALFGGSFNPPHLGHELAALYVLETADVDELWFVPTFKHPFEKALEPFEDRLAMCELARAALGARARASPTSSASSATRAARCARCARCEARHPEHRFSLVIGADLVAETDSWYGADELRGAVPFIVVGRRRRAAADGPRPAVEMPAVSSTEIRRALARGRAGHGARVARRPRLHLRARAVREPA